MTPKFTRVLFSTDLSEHARYAFKYAAGVAALYKAGIVILHVLEEETSDNTRNMLSVFLGSEKMREFEQKQEEHARSVRDILVGKRQEADIVKEALSMFYEDLKPQTFQENTYPEILVKKGDTVDEIVAATRKYECDLIVMGHGKYNALSEAVLGSTTKSVLRKSRVPVLVIPMPKKS